MVLSTAECQPMKREARHIRSNAVLQCSRPRRKILCSDSAHPPNFLGHSGSLVARPSQAAD
jgi:hypothetical protein